MTSSVFGLHDKHMSTRERRRVRESRSSSVLPVVLTLVVIALMLGAVCVLAF